MGALRDRPRTDTLVFIADDPALQPIADLLTHRNPALATAATIRRVGCPLELCTASVPAGGNVEAALHAHAAQAHRRLIDAGNGAELARLIADWAKAAAA